VAQFFVNTPLLSVIVATYNAGATLARCLQSIFCQTFGNWEIIIVDGGSSDSTLDIIRQNESAIAYWHSHPDAGIYDAWNQALAHARGKYVMFIGADDALHDPDALGRLFRAIGHEEYDLVSSRGVLRDASWRELSEVGGAWNYDVIPRRMGILHPGLLHRQDLFSQHGMFDANLRIVGDLDFLLRLPKSVRTLDLPSVTVDVQNDGVSRKLFWRRLRERRQVHLRCARVGPLRAYLYWLDKAWRMPIARLLGLQY
jgi:glycosyltransferase involved in cell wall biosynthesis